MPVTLLMLHIEPELPAPLPAFRVPYCPDGKPSDK